METASWEVSGGDLLVVPNKKTPILPATKSEVCPINNKKLAISNIKAELEKLPPSESVRLGDGKIPWRQWITSKNV